jgi:hypothetical protein
MSARAPQIARATDDNARDAAEWVCRMRAGDFAAAWRLSDRIRARAARFGDPGVPRHEQIIWDGAPLDDRHVLVRCYHGLGDTIQFARYLPLLRRRARRVTVWAQPPLLRLLRSLDADLTLAALHDGSPAVQYDVDIEIMELPYAFRTTLETIPARTPYLEAGRPTRRLHDRPRIGIFWRGGSWNTARSIPFVDLRLLLDDRRVRWYSLQPDATPAERHPWLRTIDVSTVNRAARAMQRLDLVISVDSMPAHLAGALGRPVWTLLPRDADWRWMEQRDDSPWYPTMRLFRNAEVGGWDGVVRGVHEALGRLFPPDRTQAGSGTSLAAPPALPIAGPHSL